MKSIYYDPNLQEGEKNRKWFENVKLIGEIDKGTSIYIEDFAYTYLHQYANSQLSSELSAVLIGKHFKELNQVAVYGVIPIKKEGLISGEKWISKRMLDIIDEERKHYFLEGEYVGWMHTQPGYGIMSTTQEAAVHKEVFGDQGLLMLVDPVYNAEAFFTYKGDLLTLRKGFCIYYEKNESMQKYMADHSIGEKNDQEGIDKVVGEFRELGSRWKREVERKGKRNRAIKRAVAGVLLITLFVVGIYSQQRKSGGLEREVANIQEQYSEVEDKILDKPVEIIFTSTQVEPGYDIHAVEIGDSLLSISYEYYETVAMVKEIAELNSIMDCDTIYIGQKLKIPRR